MVRLFGIFLIIASMGIFAFKVLSLDFYLLSGSERLSLRWQQDYETLRPLKGYNRLFPQIRKVELVYSDPQVNLELEDLKHPFSVNPKGRYILRVSVIRWIENREYGYLLEHEVFENSEGSEEKLFEFGRSHTIGIFW